MRVAHSVISVPPALGGVPLCQTSKGFLARDSDVPVNRKGYRPMMKIRVFSLELLKQCCECGIHL